MSITKAELAEKIKTNADLTLKESAEILETVFEIVKERLEAGDRLKISGFGVFEVKQKKDRIGRNPQTGEQITIKSRRIVSFKPSTVLKLAINR